MTGRLMEIHWSKGVGTILAPIHVFMYAHDAH